MGSKEMKEGIMFAYKAFFEQRADDSYRLRVFISCVINGDEVTGVVAGYSGGGCFEKEDFFAHIKGNTISSCIIYGEDRVTGNTSDVKFKVPDDCEKIFNTLVFWNEDDDNMHLDPECSIKPSSKEGDYIDFAGGDTDMPDAILYNLPSLAGLTGGWKPDSN